MAPQDREGRDMGRWDEDEIHEQSGLRRLTAAIVSWNPSTPMIVLIGILAVTGIGVVSTLAAGRGKSPAAVEKPPVVVAQAVNPPAAPAPPAQVAEAAAKPVAASAAVGWPWATCGITSEELARLGNGTTKRRIDAHVAKQDKALAAGSPERAGFEKRACANWQYGAKRLERALAGGQPVRAARKGHGKRAKAA
jgi:hypothetical protein